MPSLQHYNTTNRLYRALTITDAERDGVSTVVHLMPVQSLAGSTQQSSAQRTVVFFGLGCMQYRHLIHLPNSSTRSSRKLIPHCRNPVRLQLYSSQQPLMENIWIHELTTRQTLAKGTRKKRGVSVRTISPPCSVHESRARRASISWLDIAIPASSS